MLIIESILPFLMENRDLFVNNLSNELLIFTCVFQSAECITLQQCK